MKTKKENRQIVGYIRSAVKDDLSVKKQERNIKNYCSKNGVKLTKVFVDNGCSGANLQRPALNELLTEVSTDKIQQVVIYDADRLTRNRKDYITLKKLMEKYGVEVRTVLGIVSRSNDLFDEDIDVILETINDMKSQLDICKRRRHK